MDDIVVRIHPAGEHSRVDVRSTSAVTRPFPTSYNRGMAKQSIAAVVALIVISNAVSSVRGQSLEEVKRLLLLYPKPVAAIAVTKDRVYREAPALKFDEYRPAGVKGKLPAVILIHGDAPPDVLKDIKDWAVYVSYGRLLASRGFVAIIFNHRSSEEFSKLHESASDVDRMVKYIQTHAETLGIDAEALSVWAFSAGGPYLAPLFRATPHGVRCFLAFYAVMGIPESATASPELREEFSPAAALPQNFAVPIFVARAGRDDPSFNKLNDGFLIKAIEKNAAIRIMNYQSGQHAFDIFDDQPETRRVITEALAFLKANTARHP